MAEPQARDSDPETKAHRALDAAFDWVFEQGRLAGLRDARDSPDAVVRMIADIERWL